MVNVLFCSCVAVLPVSVPSLSLFTWNPHEHPPTGNVPSL